MTAVAVLSTRSSFLRGLTWALLGANLLFTAGTALFIYEWGHRSQHSSLTRGLIGSGLVQFHLATENVLAAWYSSMLLLSVALASGLAFAVERPRERTGVDRWLSAGWLLMAAAFVALSLDEIGSFHERIGMVESATTAARGWVYVLIGPILLTAAFMLAFAWMRIRRARGALVLFGVGTALFLSNPVFELVEMSILHGGGNPNAMVVHDTLLVIEEGVVELGGALCFLLAVLRYIRHTVGGGPHTFEMRTAPALSAALLSGMLLAAGVPLARWLVRQLPPGDTGIPDNWFPAAALYGFALLHLGVRGRRGAPLAGVALALSAFFGAGLYAYLSWYRFDILRQVLQTLLMAGFAVLCTREARRQPSAPAAYLVAGAMAMAFAIGVRGAHTASLATFAAAFCSMGSLTLRRPRRAKAIVALRSPLPAPPPRPSL